MLWLYQNLEAPQSKSHWNVSVFMVVLLCTPNICSWVDGVHFCEGLFIGSVLCYLDKSTLKVHCFYKVFLYFSRAAQSKKLLSYTSRWKQEQSNCSTAFSKSTGMFCGSFTHDSKVFLRHITHLTPFLRQLYYVSTFSWLLYPLIYLVSRTG